MRFPRASLNSNRSDARATTLQRLVRKARSAAVVSTLLGAVHAAPFEWQTASPENHGFSAAKLDALREQLASHSTKTFLLIRDDRIIYEWYAPSHSAVKPHYSASMAKALVGGVSVAVALTDGRLLL